MYRFEPIILLLSLILATASIIELRDKASIDDYEVPLSRITGGTDASPTDIPWAAGVLIHGGTSGHDFCSGVLISRRYALTAANCVSGYVCSLKVL